MDRILQISRVCLGDMGPTYIQHQMRACGIDGDRLNDDDLRVLADRAATNFSHLDTMEGALRLEVPVLVDVKAGSNWGEMKELAP